MTEHLKLGMDTQNGLQVHIQCPYEYFFENNKIWNQHLFFH